MRQADPHPARSPYWRIGPFAALFAVAAIAQLAGWLQPLDRAVSAGAFHLSGRRALPEVVVVAIDPRSLSELEVWPWPRGYYATVLENLLEAGARRVGFDIDFSSRSIAEEDLELERAVAAAGSRVVLPVFMQRSSVADPFGRLTLTGPLPELRREAILGTINVAPDGDGRARRYPYAGEFLGLPVPSFAAALVGESVRGAGEFEIDFGIAPDSIPRISFVEALTGRFDPELVRGRAVIVGSTAIELGDQLAVPRAGTLPGCIVQALAVESLAQRRDLAPTGPAAGLLLTLAVCGLFALLDGRLGWRGGLAVAGSIALAVPLGAIAIQTVVPRTTSLTAAGLAALACYGLSLVRRVDRQAVGLVVQDRQIRETESLMRHVVSNSFDAIVTLRVDGRLVTFNRVAQKMFGYAEDEAVGRNISDFVRLPHAELRDARGSEPRAGHRALYESEGVAKDGRRFPVELAVTWIVAEGVRRRVMFMRDISERKAQQEALRYQATHDALTDLPNRNLLQERVEEALAAARQHGSPVGFLLLDLDRFKEINDTLGHHIGDLLLRKIARRLEGAIRESDTIARLGGDEFAVLLPATGLDNARQMAHKLLQSLDEPFQVEGLALQVSTSVGISLFPEHGTGATALIRRADVAMYAAKRERTAILIYDPDQDFSSVRLLSLTGDLRRAIQEDGLRLHYQPKISAADGRAIGVEALARWRHPEHGEIRPEEFIGLAEHGGLIRELTHWVLETALRQNAAWRREGIDLTVSVNVSARNLLDEDLPRSMRRMLRASGVPVDRLTLEITESVIMEDPKRALECLTEIHSLGVEVAIDDFGTGYSSLAYLKKLPASEIKIDKSFVQDMDREPDDRTIVHSTIELAHNLGLSVVAEGVESEETWAELRRLGCDVGQGFLFGRPMPAARIAEWYVRHEAGEARPGAEVAALVARAEQPTDRPASDDQATAGSSRDE